MFDLSFLEPERKTLKIKKAGDTILETALANHFPLYHLCGGNARCTTCRVFVTHGLSSLSERNDREKTIADRKGWPKEIRLSCQTEIFGNVDVQRIIRDEEDLKTVTSETKSSKTGEECYAAILFLDIKGFTSFTESSLAYDVVFVLNRFFQEMSEPILNNGGFIDKFIGDGILAYFFLDKTKLQSSELSLEEAKKQMFVQALRACFRMFDQLQKFNSYVKERFHHEFEIRLGLHAGQVIYGDIGHSDHKSQTVLGDTVNVASRLEALNKKTGTRFLISDEIYKYISDKIQIDKKILTRLRGKTDKMAAYSVLGFKEKDTILELQRSLELALHLNPNLARDFYVHFLETKPEFQKFFQNTDMETQAKKLLAMFGRTIERFGNLNQIHNELKNLGKMHEEMGIKVTDLAEIAPSLLYALEKSLGERFQTEWKPIWEEALGSLVRLMSF
ncbi:adenylate/guanylate cyclase domain-containing protein [Leptospira terpstrae]|uniref:Adenylate/guanylate cyclase catalytic domain protein n=1 Tax=Leptospira terpstrae serovar Hualin str. LT 11-33 = ATCC 700639 TaxID=1257025 RepID=N1VY19_9LEPT|nr:adenylate/guanylate cyclase domain-containing protein [Leptospira terpstrae]EMY61935.1 adenylate/guanylate cyclase catalytic domain protein [Leptospira terpstrae serovar Hualin str. LT 11-33 = ATCC 700639]